MFGEDLIIGHSTVKFDSKNRIFVPSFRGVEPKEQLIVEKTIEENDIKLILHAYKKFLELVKKLKDIQEKTTSKEELFECQQKIDNLCMYLAAKVTVDNNKRIIIPNYLIEEIGWDRNIPVNLHGLGTTLLVSQKK